MYTIPQRGFFLKCPKDYPQERYMEVKANIESLYRKVEEQGLPAGEYAFTLRINKNLHFAFYIQNQELSLGVYNVNTKTLNRDIDIALVECFTSPQYIRMYETIISRMYEIKHEKHILPELESVWKQLLLKEKIAALTPESEDATKYAKAFYGQIRDLSGDIAQISRNTGLSKEQIAAVKEYVFRKEPDFFIAHSWQRLMGKKDNIAHHDMTMLKNKICELDFLSRGFSETEAKNNADAMYDYQWESSGFYGSQKQQKQVTHKYEEKNDSMDIDYIR